MIDFLRDTFLFWRPVCLHCLHRRPIFIDHLCFSCEMAAMEKRLNDWFMTEISKPENQERLATIVHAVNKARLS